MNADGFNDDRELDRLIDRMCDQIASVDELAALGRRLAEEPAARDHYIACLELHARLAWQMTPVKPFSPEELHRYSSEERGTRGEGFGNWEIGRLEDLPQDIGSLVELPNHLEAGVHPSPFILHPSSLPLSSLSVGGPIFSYMVATIVLGLMLLGAWTYTITHDQHGNYVHKNSRGLTAPGSLTQQPSDPVFVGRVTGLKDCRWADPRTETYAGASVPLGRKYALSAGLLEITYRSGAKVILEGPCSYEVESATGGVLSLGKLTARVERAKPQAVNRSSSPRDRSRGAFLSFIPHPSSFIPHPSSLFTVRTPTAVVTDLGTEFGVEVGDNGNTVSHVFRGSVKVQALDNGEEQCLTINANETASVERNKEGNAVVIRQKAVSASFVCRMPRRTTIEVFNTGVGAKEGDSDPHWQIVARSDDPKFVPRQAVVATVKSPWFLANNPKRSQWISFGGDLPDLPNGATFTFRTTFECPAIPNDPYSSVMMRGGFIVDNCVTAIRLNGRLAIVPAHGKESPFVRLNAFTIDRGFIEGTNVLEIDVSNGIPGDESVVSPMALLVELKCVAFYGGRDAAVSPNSQHLLDEKKTK